MILVNKKTPGPRMIKTSVKIADALFEAQFLDNMPAKAMIICK
jgi:hypothetical protein